MGAAKHHWSDCEIYDNLITVQKASICVISFSHEIFTTKDFYNLHLLCMHEYWYIFQSPIFYTILTVYQKIVICAVSTLYIPT